MNIYSQSKQGKTSRSVPVSGCRGIPAGRPGPCTQRSRSRGHPGSCRIRGRGRCPGTGDRIRSRRDEPPRTGNRAATVNEHLFSIETGEDLPVCPREECDIYGENIGRGRQRCTGRPIEIHARHHHVQQNERKALLAGQAQPVLRCLGDGDIVVVAEDGFPSISPRPISSPAWPTAASTISTAR